MSEPKQQPSVLVSSTVYGIEELLDRVYALLTSLGYDVWMSRAGSLFVRSDQTAFENCLDAVARCDLFLCIITPSYGTGVDTTGLSITHREPRRAIELDKPRWLLAHSQVVFARRFLRDLGHTTPEERQTLTLKPGARSIADLRVIDMYEEAIRHDTPLEERYGNWVHEFETDEDAMRFAVAQFSRFQEVEDFIHRNLIGPDRVMAELDRRSEASNDHQ